MQEEKDIRNQKINDESEETKKAEKKEEKIEVNVLWILFHSKEEIVQFVDTCQDFDDAIDVKVGKKRTDAKSIMGMLLLDIEEPIEIEYSCYDSEDNFLEFKEMIMSKYQVKEKKQDFK